jgi:hypothetical protein
MTRADAANLRRPMTETRRREVYGAIQPQSSDTKHVARWVWAVVVGVSAAVGSWWL